MTGDKRTTLVVILQYYMYTVHVEFVAIDAKYQCLLTGTLVYTPIQSIHAYVAVQIMYCTTIYYKHVNHIHTVSV